jgi:hypothetical protein
MCVRLGSFFSGSCEKTKIKGYPEIFIAGFQKSKITYKTLLLAKNFFATMVESVRWIGKDLADRCAIAQRTLGSAARTMILTRVPGSTKEFFSMCRKIGLPKESSPEKILTFSEEFVQKTSEFVADGMASLNWFRSAFQLTPLAPVALIGNIGILVKNICDFFEASVNISHCKKLKEYQGRFLTKNEMEDVQRKENNNWIKVMKNVSFIVLISIVIIGFQFTPMGFIFLSATNCIGTIWDNAYEEMSKSIKETRTS